MHVRPLRDWEVAHARLVFGDSLDYHSVVVHEGVFWTDTVSRLDRWVRHIPPPPAYTPNAITIANHCFFPIILPHNELESDHWRYSFGWLIHELTHVWQYQNEGWSYLIGALAAHLTLGTRAYDFGGAAGLALANARGRSLSSFNPEQQGAILQTYCDRRRDAGDVSDWLPYVNELLIRG